MQINNQVAFGIKVPTQHVINLVAGDSGKNSFDLISTLSGVPKEQILTKMNSDLISFNRDNCAKEIVKQKPEFAPLLKAKEALTEAFSRLNCQKGKPSMSEISDLFVKKEAEAEKLAKKLDSDIDIDKINLIG
ncbi:MAG: hypothetical protein PHV37_07065 [Candidatus Gastranaerophilales bacterium]|nr:hypothetical protein [Candidatus Gastranaerophilales bacterium]